MGMIIERAVSANLAEIRDDGALKYYRVHPNWYDTVNSMWVRAYPQLVAANPATDGWDYMCRTGHMIYGVNQTTWAIGVRRRTDGVQFRTRPRYLTRWGGTPSIAKLNAVVFDTAVNATSLDVYTDGERYGARWQGVFQHCEIRAIVGEGGELTVRHKVLSSAKSTTAYDWYGTVWEVETNSVDFVKELANDGEKDTRFFAFSNGGKYYFCEYFPSSLFVKRGINDEDLGAQDVEHNYTTISAGLGADLALARGSTYYLTANCTLGTYNITTTGSSGRVTVKTSGAVGFRVNGAGTFTASYIDFTSSNDNSRGDAISGSSGSPAAADQTSGYLLATGTTATSISLTEFGFHYSSLANQAVVGWNASAAGRTVFLTNGVMRNITLGPSTARTCFIGNYGAATYNCGQIIVDNLSIDSTCQTTSTTNIILLNLYLTSSNSSLKNSFLAPQGTFSAGVIVYGVSNTWTVSNNVFAFSAAYAATNGALTAQGGTGTVTANLTENTVVQAGTGNGVMFYEASGTLNGTIRNCIIVNCTGVSAVGLTQSNASVTHTYNDYYNNTTHAFEPLAASEQTLDPQLGNLPSGAIRSPGYSFADGYSVNNSSLWKSGSDTYDNLSIEETLYSSNGYGYRGTDKITVGAQYKFSWFANDSSDHAIGRGIGCGIGRGIG